MNPVINAYPNPFVSRITVEVTADQERQHILRLFGMNGRFVKIVSWKLQKGTNIAVLNDLDSIENGTYTLDIIDEQAHVLNKTMLQKK